MNQKNASFSYQQHEADWSKGSRGKELISTVNMSNWVLLHTQRDMQIANDFVQTIKKVCGPMGMRVDEPRK